MPPPQQRQQQHKEGQKHEQNIHPEAQHLPDRNRPHRIIPWEKPWQSPHFTGGPFPCNFLTGKPYRGVNALLLWSGSYASPFWLTFKQAQELKRTVRKGEKGTQIVFYKQLRSRKEDAATTDTEKERAPFVLCYYTVSASHISLFPSIVRVGDYTAKCRGSTSELAMKRHQLRLLRRRL